MLEYFRLRYYGMAMNRRLIVLPQIAAAGCILVMTGAALAKNPANAAPRPTLPGVDGDYRIVRPMPEPADPDPQAESQFKIGDMNVRIGGSVTVDVGAGARGRSDR